MDILKRLLVYLKPYALQVVHGRLFGLGQSKANQWLHVLLPVLQAALTALGDTPSRTLTALAERLGVSAEAAAALLPPAEPVSSSPAAVAPAPPAVGVPAPPAPPLLLMMGPRGGSGVPKIPLSRRAVIAASRSAIP